MIRCVKTVYAKPDGRLVVEFKDRTTTRHARLVAAIKLQRPLLPSEVVHHINGDCSDDTFSNLEVLSSKGTHVRLHIEQRRSAHPYCPSGHLYSEYGFLDKDSVRRCRECNRQKILAINNRNLEAGLTSNGKIRQRRLRSDAGKPRPNRRKP